MFNLEREIARWRKQMLAGGINTPVPLEELEAHLRDEIESLMAQGWDGQKAFDNASQKIGSAGNLRNEFAKDKLNRNQINWRVLEIFFLGFLVFYPLLTVFTAFFLKNGSFSEMNLLQQISSVAAAGALSLAAYGMRWVRERHPIIRTNQARDIIFVPVLIWLLALAYVIPHGTGGEGQSAVAFMWGLVPFGILIGWISGFATDARIKAG